MMVYRHLLSYWSTDFTSLLSIAMKKAQRSLLCTLCIQIIYSNGGIESANAVNQPRKTFITSPSDYPDTTITNIIYKMSDNEMFKSIKKEFFQTREQMEDSSNPPFGPPPSKDGVSQRIKVTKTSSKSLPSSLSSFEKNVCDSEPVYEKPRWAQNTKGIWKYIV